MKSFYFTIFAIIILCLSLSSATILPKYKLENFRYVVHQDENMLRTTLPSEVELQTSNNCLSIIYFGGRMYFAWRTAPFHFASPKVNIYIISSADNGTLSWDFEHKIELGTDMREPYFVVVDNVLHFSFFQAGTTWYLFQPKGLFKIQRNGFQNWSTPEKWGSDEEIVWQYQQYNGKTYAGSYKGTHYGAQSNINLFFNVSDSNFSNFKPIINGQDYVYQGGISELGFTFDDNGDIYAVGRNEDGDASGWGSRFFKVEKKFNYQNWKQIFPSNSKSNPNIYESPRMFTWKNKVFLVARRELNSPYDLAPSSLPFVIKKFWNLLTYSFRAHTSAIYMLDKTTMELHWIVDIPGCGDTAFPSIIQISDNTFTIANYASKLEHPNWSWLRGQFSQTQIYFIDLTLIDEQQEKND